VLLLKKREREKERTKEKNERSSCYSKKFAAEKESSCCWNKRKNKGQKKEREKSEY
jgi:hypothetical protein